MLYCVKNEAAQLLGLNLAGATSGLLLSHMTVILSSDCPLPPPGLFKFVVNLERLCSYPYCLVLYDF